PVPRGRAGDLLSPTGPAQFRLHTVPRRQLEGEARRLADHAGAPDRLSDLPAGMAGHGVAAAPAAQLHHRHAGGELSVRRARAHRPRALSDVARARHAARNAGGAAVASGAEREDTKARAAGTYPRPACGARVTELPARAVPNSATLMDSRARQISGRSRKSADSP